MGDVDKIFLTHRAESNTHIILLYHNSNQAFLSLCYAETIYHAVGMSWATVPVKSFPN